MTATSYNGFEVILDEPTPSNLPPKADGSIVVMPSIRKLTLSNGEVVYGCVECDKVYPGERGHFQVRPHLSKHRKAVSKARAARSSGPQAVDFAKFLRQQERALVRAEEQAEYWKARALKAERLHSAIRSAVRPVMETA